MPVGLPSCKMPSPIPKDAQDLFDRLVPEALLRAPERARQLDTVLCFKIVGDLGGTWTIDCSQARPAPTCTSGAVEGAARCTVEVSRDDFQAMLLDPKVATQLYGQGKLRIAGDPMHAPKIAALFDIVRG